MSEPRHPPSPERLARAWREGDTPRSPALVAAVAVTAAALVAPLTAAAMRSVYSAQLRRAVDSMRDPTPRAALEGLRSAAVELLALGLPMLGAVFVAACAASLAQTRGAMRPWSVSRGTPEPWADRVWGLALGAAALGLSLGALLTGLQTLVTADTPDGRWSGLRSFGVRTIAALVLLGVMDLAWRGWRRTRRLRMTDDELHREAREESGSPELRARRRDEHRDMTGRVSPPPGST